MRERTTISAWRFQMGIRKVMIKDLKQSYSVFTERMLTPIRGRGEMVNAAASLDESNRITASQVSGIFETVDYGGSNPPALTIKFFKSKV